MIGVLAPWNMDALLTSQRGMDGNLTNVYFRVESPALFDDVTRHQCFAVRIKYGTNCTWLNIYTQRHTRTVRDEEWFSCSQGETETGQDIRSVLFVGQRDFLHGVRFASSLL